MTERSSSDYTVPRGPYTVWLDYGYEGWKWRDYDTLEEALVADRHSSVWVITKAISYQVIET